MIVFSDLHLHDYGLFSSPWKYGLGTRFHAQLDVLDHIFSLAVELEERSIVFVGDWWHKWDALETRLYSVGTKHLFNLVDGSDINLFMIAGNHDLIDKGNSTVNTIAGFAGHPSITVIEKPTLVDVDDRPCVMIPYNEDYGLVLKHILKFKGKDRWLFAHIDIIGAKAGIDGYESKSGISVDVLSEYAGVTAGHYHTPQSFKVGHGSYQYVGSPLHLSPINTSETHGIIQLKGDKAKRHNILAPEFVKLKSGDSLTSLNPINYHLISCSREEAPDVNAELRKNPDILAKIVLDKEEKSTHQVYRDVPESKLLPTYAKKRASVCGLDYENLMAYFNYYVEKEI